MTTSTSAAPGPAGRPARSLQRHRVPLLYAALTVPLVPVALLAPVAVSDVTYLLLGLSAVVAILVGVRLHQPTHRVPWFVMAVGQFFWCLGDGAWMVIEDVLGEDPYPSVADLFYLGGYPVLVLSLAMLLLARGRGRELTAELDSAIVVAGLATLSWAFLAGPTMELAAASPLEALVSISYPAGDILLIAVVIRLLVTSNIGAWSLRLLVAALAVLVLADSLVVVADLYGGGSTLLGDGLYLVSYLLWGAAALHPTMRSVTEPATGRKQVLRVQRIVAMAVAAVVTPGILVVQSLAGLPISVWAVAIGSLVMFLLVLVRMNVAINQIAAMSRQRKRLQEELHHQASHDALTGLPNRPQALLLVNEALQRARRTGDDVTVLFVDLDGFKGVNDTMGHRAGDEVLRVVASRLSAAIRHGDIAARLGGDEFVVMLEGAPGSDSAAQVAERVIDTVSETISLGPDADVRVGASVGIATSHRGEGTADELVHDADQALYRAKADGKGRHVIFGAELREELSEQARLEVALRQAIASHELRLHYQPVIDVTSGTLRGYEALVRWERPGEGLLLPWQFLPVAESSDLICELDSWVLLEATRQLAAWSRVAGHDNLLMSVNVSGRHVARRRFVDDVVEAIAMAGIRPRQLVVEVTETALAEHRTAIANLTELRRLGVAVSLDDFGTGYSRIGQLTRLPVDSVKIAREYLEPGPDANRKLLELMVQAAHSAGLPVVGAGVERADQLEVLQQLGCDSAQGYYLGRPTSSADVDTSMAGEPLGATA